MALRVERGIVGAVSKINAAAEEADVCAAYSGIRGGA